MTFIMDVVDEVLRCDVSSVIGQDVWHGKVD